jgi:Uma2 family endonuclease
MTIAVGRRPFTVEEYQRMRTTGILREDDRVELIDGEVREMSPVGPLHAAIVRRLNLLLHRLLAGSHVVSVQDPMRLSDYSEPQPDLAVLRARSDFYAAAHPTPEDVLLVIEVSDASLAYDREEKLPRYAQSALPEVWLVAVDPQQIERYAGLANGRYELVQVYGRGQSVTSLSVPGLAVAVNDVLG